MANSNYRTFQRFTRLGQSCRPEQNCLLLPSRRQGISTLTTPTGLKREVLFCSIFWKFASSRLGNTFTRFLWVLVPLLVSFFMYTVSVIHPSAKRYRSSSRRSVERGKTRFYFKGFSGRHNQTEIFFAFTSFLIPGIIYKVNLAKDSWEPQVRFRFRSG